MSDFDECEKCGDPRHCSHCDHCPHIHDAPDPKLTEAVALLREGNGQRGLGHSPRCRCWDCRVRAFLAPLSSQAPVTESDDECIRCIKCRRCCGACDCTGGPQTGPECTCYELTGGHQPGCHFNRARPTQEAGAACPAWCHYNAESRPRHARDCPNWATQEAKPRGTEQAPIRGCLLCDYKGSRCANHFPTPAAPPQESGTKERP